MARLFVSAAVCVALAASASALCDEPCPSWACGPPVVCPNPAAPYVCTNGSVPRKACATRPWAPAQGCTKCCNAAKSCPKNNCAKQCSADVCAKAQCNKKTTPFVCTDGPEHGACGPKVTTFETFPENVGCYGCCDLSTCAGTPTASPHPATPSPAPKNLTCGQCSAKQCEFPRACPNPQVPFKCTASRNSTNGPTGGCAAQWPDTACTECCDMRTCPKIDCNGACPPSVCNNNACSIVNPFICSKGPEMGACAPTASIFANFPESSGCYACCDLAKCPQGDRTARRFA